MLLYSSVTDNHDAAGPIAHYVLARDVIYTSLAYATMSVSVCLSVCL